MKEQYSPLSTSSETVTSPASWNTGGLSLTSVIVMVKVQEEEREVSETWTETVSSVRDS